MRHKHVSISQRVLAMALAIVMVFGMVPPATATSLEDGVLVPSRPGSGQYGNPTVGGESQTVVVDEETMEAKLNSYVLEETTVNDQTGWWLDLDIEVQPDTQTVEQVMYWAKYQIDVTYGEVVDTETGKFADKCAEGDVLGHFDTKLPDADTIKQLAYEGKMLKVEWKFDWNGDETFDQVITLDVNPAELTLKNAEGEIVYPAAVSQYGTVSQLSEGLEINAENPYSIAVGTKDVTLDWVPADPAIGRNVDGWWVGIRIDAPEMEQALLEKVQFTTGSRVLNFWECRESADNAQTHFITIWVNVNDILFKGEMAPRTYGFDWNLDGVYEQNITLNISKLNAGLTLKQDGRVITGNKVALNVTVRGDGAVKINGEVAESSQEVLENLAYNLELVPDNANTRVDSIKFNGTAISLENLPTYFAKRSYGRANNLEVTFVTKYKVSVPEQIPEGCKVELRRNGKTNPTGEYSPDEVATCTITAGKGYRIREVKYGDEVIQISDNTRVFFSRKVTADTALTVVFVPVYEINVTIDGNGEVLIDDEAVEGKVTVEQDPGSDKLILKAEPGENHRVTKVLVDDQELEVPGENSANFETELEYGNHQVRVTFAPNVYTLRVEGTGLEHVEISGLPEGKVEHGAKVTLNLTPAEGYLITGVTAEGAEVETNDMNTVVTVTVVGDTVLMVTASLKAYKVIAEESELAEVKFFKGDMELTAEDTVNHGETIQVRVTPAEGYLVNTLQIKDKNNETKKFVDVVNGVAEITVDMDMTIVAVAEKVKAVKLSDVQLRLSTEGLLRQDGGLYIYRPNTVVRITASTVENEIITTAQFRIGFAANNTNDVIYKEHILSNGGELLMNAENGDGQYSNTEVDGVAYVLQYRSPSGWANVVDENEEPIRIMFDTDKPALGEVKLSEVAEGAEEGYYAADLTFDAGATDLIAGSIDYTGISAVEYVLSETELDAEALETVQWMSAELTAVGSEAEAKAAITAENYNGKVMHLSLRVTDAAGNVQTVLNVEKFHVDTKAPEAEVTVTGEKKEAALEGFLSVDERSVTITLDEWTETFNQEKAVLTLQKDNKAVDADVEWQIVDGKPVAAFTVEEEGAYEWSMVYTSRTGAVLNIGSDSQEFKFTIDQTAPVGDKLKVDDKKAPDFLGELLEKITFGFFKNGGVTYTTEWDDATEIIEKTYLKSDLSIFDDVTDMAALVAKLEQLYQNGEFVTSNKWEDVADGDAVIFARAVDAAGNVGYTSTEGVIFDSKEPVIDVMITEGENESGWFSDDFDVSIKVTDNVLEGIAGSGLKKVTYEVSYAYEDWWGITKKKVVASDEIQHNEQAYAEADRGSFAEYTADFKVDVLTNKYEDKAFYDYTLTVTAEDFSGNKTTYETMVEVNVAPPEATIIMDEGIDRPAWAKENYYNYRRTATIKISDHDRSWAPDNVTLEGIDPSWITSPWAKVGSEYVATVTFPEVDGEYEWSIAYTNKHGMSLDQNTVEEDKNDNTFHFYQDFTAPGAEVSTGNFWGKFVEFITFGLIKNDAAEIGVTVTDNYGMVQAYAYCHQADTDPHTGEKVPMTEAALNELRVKGFEPVKLKDGAGSVSVGVDEQTTVVYFFVSDYAGNGHYLNSTGIIVEDKAPEVEVKADKTKINAAVEKVTLTINASDFNGEKLFSGVKSMSYSVEAPDGSILIEETPYGTSFAKTEPKYSELWKEKVWTLELNAEMLDKINYTGARVVVKVLDNAGNEGVGEIKLNVDRTCPTVLVSFDANDLGNEGYYNKDREATVTFTERSQHFTWNDEAINNNDAVGAVMSSVVAKNVKGDVIKLNFNSSDVYIYDKKDTEGQTPNGDADQHTMKVAFRCDANFDWSKLSFVDALGNPATVTFEGAYPTVFTVDKTDPTGSLTAVPDGRADLAGVWKDQVGNDRGEMIFEMWASDKMSVSATAEDVTSPIAKVEYYISTLSRSMAESELVNANWTGISIDKMANFFEAKEDMEFAVYLRITDKANNQAYLRTDGLICDNKLPNLGETKAPVIEVVAPYNGQLHNSDVVMDIAVSETGLVKSGLKSISYEVFNDDISTTKPTQSGELWSFKFTDPKKINLVNEQKEKLTVIAKNDQVNNNSNNLRVVITAVDNAGNVQTKTIPLMIDVTKPTISVSYNNNSGIKHQDGQTYFSKTRVATVTVTERNFNAELVKIAIAAAHGSKAVMSDWSRKAGTKANGDDTVWTATITYSADDDYTFDISCTDTARNGNEGVNYGSSVAPKAFTVDQTKPVISVSYDNNADNNGNGYFKAFRTATITIQEHNFDKDQVDITLGASLNGSSIANPAVSGWRQAGENRWVATVSYHADGDYTFDVTAKDKAGNDSGAAGYGNSVAPKVFTVDTTLVEPTITGVESGKAYPAELIPSISFTDVNFAGYELKLLRTNLGIIEEDISKEMTDLIQQTEQSINGVFDIFQIISNDPGAKDGIYKLTLKVWDDAGNESIQELIFSINRNGSVYVYGEYLTELLKQGHVTAIDGDLTVTEYNADRLVADSLLVRVTHNGRAIADVALAPEPVINDKVAPGEMGWYEYVYTLSKDYFTEDGVYQITYSSKDAAGNTSDNSEVRFVVDSEKPELSSIIGMEEEIVNAPSLDVRFSAFDSIGLKSITILVDGEVVKTITEFGDDINNYSDVFTLEESQFARKVQIIVEDMAGNILDTDAEDFAPVYEFNKQITVSTNFFVRWYANTVLFWSSIAAMGLLAYLLWFFLIFKRKKKEEEETVAQK